MKKKYFARPLVSDCEDHNNRHLLSVKSNQTICTWKSWYLKLVCGGIFRTIYLLALSRVF